MSQLDDYAAEWVLHRIPSPNLPQLGVKLLEAGWDSPTLRILAGLPAFEEHKASAYWHQALTELEVSLPTNLEAHKVLARRHAVALVHSLPPSLASARQFVIDGFYELDPDSDPLGLGEAAALLSEIDDFLQLRITDAERYDGLITEYTLRLQSEAQDFLART